MVADVSADLQVAHEVGRSGSIGDRAVVLAPQGLDYIAAFLGVGPGTIPTTTSRKIKRAACVEQYRHERFARLDA